MGLDLKLPPPLSSSQDNLANACHFLITPLLVSFEELFKKKSILRIELFSCNFKWNKLLVKARLFVSVSFNLFQYMNALSWSAIKVKT